MIDWYRSLVTYTVSKEENNSISGSFYTKYSFLRFGKIAALTMFIFSVVHKRVRGRGGGGEGGGGNDLWKFFGKRELLLLEVPQTDRTLLYTLINNTFLTYWKKESDHRNRAGDIFTLLDHLLQDVPPYGTGTPFFRDMSLLLFVFSLYYLYWDLFNLSYFLKSVP
jgi:hypothetical protein